MTISVFQTRLRVRIDSKMEKQKKIKKKKEKIKQKKKIYKSELENNVHGLLKKKKK